MFFGDIFLMKSYSEVSCKCDRAIPSPTLFWWETFWQDWRRQTWCHRWPRGRQRSAPGNLSRSPLLVPYKRWICYWGKGTNTKHAKGFFSPAMYPSILLKKSIEIHSWTAKTCLRYRKLSGPQRGRGVSPQICNSAPIYNQNRTVKSIFIHWRPFWSILITFGPFFALLDAKKHFKILQSTRTKVW